MNWDKEFFGYHRWFHYQYFTDGGVDGGFQHSLEFGGYFKVNCVRLHFDVPYVGKKEAFTIRLSSIKGSAYDLILYSEQMEMVRDLVWTPENAMYFLSGDELVFSLYVLSGSNTYGLCISGWAVRE